MKPYDHNNFSSKQNEFSSELGSLGSFEDEKLNNISNTSETIENHVHNYVNSEDDNNNKNNSNSNTTASSDSNLPAEVSLPNLNQIISI